MPAAPAIRARPLSAKARPLVGLALGLGLGLALWLLRGTRVVEGLELELLDLRTRHAAGDVAPRSDIVLMQVHEDDVETLKSALALRWPWSLDVNAAIFTTLKDAGVRAVLVDVYHLDHGAGPDDAALVGTPSQATLSWLEGEGALAEEYGAALRALERAVLAYELVDEARYATPPRVAAAAPKLEVRGLEPRSGAPRARTAEVPVRRVTEGAASLGFANVVPDVDGVVRRAFPLAWRDGKPAASLALAAARLLGPVEQQEGGALVVGGRHVPLARDGSFLIDFRSKEPVTAYARVAPSQVVAWGQQRGADGALPAEARERLGGKIVVWGVNLPGQQDVVATPVRAALQGPALQATILDNLLAGSTRTAAAPVANLLLTLGAGALVGLLAMLLSGRVMPHLVTLALLALVVALAFAAFRAGTALDLFLPLATGLLTAGGTMAAKLLTEGRYNRWLEGTFSRYLAPSVIDALKHDPRLLDLGGNHREITVLFSDVAGFTSLSEKLKPPQVVELLNVYLTRHCAAVFATGGVVDKFIGDAVMAFWGDPVPQPDHALRACRTALAVQAAMPGLEPVWRGMGLTEFHVRIGLNAGSAVVGNMGSTQRFDYTAMGDTVNLASRLEGANKAFHTQILIGDPVRRHAGDAILVKPLARLGVVGRGEPLAVHELAGLAESATEELRRHVAAFTAAGEAARRGELGAARAALAEAERRKPGDGACAWLAGILDDLEAGRLATPWSGVLTLKSK
jgi:adenylate cyclase